MKMKPIIKAIQSIVEWNVSFLKPVQCAVRVGDNFTSAPGDLFVISRSKVREVTCCWLTSEGNEKEGCFRITKIPYHQYKKSHFGDKTIIRLSYLHNGIYMYYTGKKCYLYKPGNDALSWMMYHDIIHPWCINIADSGSSQDNSNW